MTEFKQIVGRGTRVHEDTGKFYFTLIDFRGATGHFADPEFDGEPVQIYEPGEDDPIVPPDPPPPGPDGPDDDEIIDDGWDPSPPPGLGPRKKIYVDGIEATIVAERVEYLDGRGKLITESLRDFTRKVLRRRFASLDDFLNRWNAADQKQAIIDEMTAEGLPLAVIVEELGKDLDPFDLVCHIAFDAKPADPPRADGGRPEAGCVHKARRPGPRRARRAARQVRGRGNAQSRRRQRAQDPAARQPRHAGRTRPSLRR